MTASPGGFGAKLCEANGGIITRYFEKNALSDDQTTTRLISVIPGTEYYVLVAPDKKLRLAAGVDVFVSVEVTGGQIRSSQTWRIKGSAVDEQETKWYRIQNQYSFTDDGSTIRKTPLRMPSTVADEHPTHEPAQHCRITVVVELGRMAQRGSGPATRELSQPPQAYRERNETKKLAVVDPLWCTALSPGIVFEFRNVATTSLDHVKLDELPEVHASLPSSRSRLSSGQKTNDIITEPKIEKAVNDAHEKLILPASLQTGHALRILSTNLETSMSPVTVPNEEADDVKLITASNDDMRTSQDDDPQPNTSPESQGAMPRCREGQPSMPMPSFGGRANEGATVVQVEAQDLLGDAHVNTSAIRTATEHSRTDVFSCGSELAGRTLRPVIVDATGKKQQRDTAHVAINQYYKLSGDNMEDRDYKDSDNHVMSDFGLPQDEQDEDDWEESDYYGGLDHSEDDLDHPTSPVEASPPVQPVNRRTRMPKKKPGFRIPSSSPELPSPARMSRGPALSDGENIIVTPRSQRSRNISVRVQPAAQTRPTLSSKVKKRSLSVASVLSQNGTQEQCPTTKRQRRPQTTSWSVSPLPFEQPKRRIASSLSRAPRKSPDGACLASYESKPHCESSLKPRSCSEDEDDDEVSGDTLKPEVMSPVHRHEAMLQAIGREERAAESDKDEDKELLPATSRATDGGVETHAEAGPDSIKPAPAKAESSTRRTSSTHDATESHGARDDSAVSMLEENAHQEEPATVKQDPEIKLEQPRTADYNNASPSFELARTSGAGDYSITRGSSPVLPVRITAEQPVLDDEVDAANPLRRKPVLQDVNEVTPASAALDQRDQIMAISAKKDHMEQNTLPHPASPIPHGDAAQDTTDATLKGQQPTTTAAPSTADAEENGQKVALLLLEMQENDFHKRQAMLAFEEKEPEIKRKLIMRGHKM